MRTNTTHKKNKKHKKTRGKKQSLKKTVFLPGLRVIEDMIAEVVFGNLGDRGVNQFEKLVIVVQLTLSGLVSKNAVPVCPVVSDMLAEI